MSKSTNPTRTVELTVSTIQAVETILAAVAKSAAWAGLPQPTLADFVQVATVHFTQGDPGSLVDALYDVAHGNAGSPGSY